MTTKNIPDGDNRVEDIIAPFLSQIESSDSTILLVQNGIGIDVPLIKAFPNNLILSEILVRLDMEERFIRFEWTCYL